MNVLDQNMRVKLELDSIMKNKIKLNSSDIIDRYDLTCITVCHIPSNVTLSHPINKS